MSRQNEFGASWWAKRWREEIENIYEGNRMQRGRTYARDGYVEKIRLVEGDVHADVAGRRIRPYKVVIALQKATVEQRKALTDILTARPLYPAMLLNGEMPLEIEDIAAKSGFPLFPNPMEKIVTDCSCPDMENPCKHIVAVLYILGSRMNEDPFFLFGMRGLSREHVMKKLHGNRKKAGGGKSPEQPRDSEQENEMLPATAYLWRAAAKGSFWSAGPHFDDVKIQLHPDALAPDALSLSWGVPDFIPGSENVTTEIANMMKRVSERAREQIERMEK